MSLTDPIGPFIFVFAIMTIAAPALALFQYVQASTKVIRKISEDTRKESEGRDEALRNEINNTLKTERARSMSAAQSVQDQISQTTFMISDLSKRLSEVEEQQRKIAEDHAHQVNMTKMIRRV